MDFLPKELEDIIMNYKHQLEENEYYCSNCSTTKYKNICNYNISCNFCKEPICIDCKKKLECLKKRLEYFKKILCNECYFNLLINDYIEDIIDRPLIKAEIGLILVLIRYIYWNDKKRIAEFLLSYLEEIEYNIIERLNILDIFSRIAWFVKNKI